MSLILPDLSRKTDENTNMKNIEDKVSNLATTTIALNARINDVKDEIPSITS